MKKTAILLTAALAAGTLLSGCSNDDDNLLQSKLKKVTIEVPALAGRVWLGINQEDIPGFENQDGSSPTEVTTQFTDVSNACQPIDASGTIHTIGQNGTWQTTSEVVTNASFNSGLASLQCAVAGTANVKISFTAGGKSYSATHRFVIV
ncbi:hypothetical protein LO80_08640 [Candidatus Francisella endociliophora]|uniref:Lipoprotein n=1 Tax=Candidatus Francisella endociliophora TaxID=653937 RepID=A0A097ER28_9GAMM|nr:hypothetical protein [Francisella sp. FSC1006]AIT10031.1 hypothetical protein LO80_08640 [Francisella sp. FSC1006]